MPNEIRSGVSYEYSCGVFASGDTTPSVGAYNTYRVFGLGGITITELDSGNYYQQVVIFGAYLNEIQTVTLTDAEAGETWDLVFNGQTTSAMAYDATAAAVDAALEALSNIGDGDVAVTGAAGGPYEVMFVDDMAEAAQADMTGTGYGGDGLSVGVVETVAGGGANTSVLDDGDGDPDEMLLVGGDWTANGDAMLILRRDHKRGVWKEQARSAW
jgi:hypothetical protein